jgi:hypothetical protein
MEHGEAVGLILQRGTLNKIPLLWYFLDIPNALILYWFFIGYWI